MAIRAGKKLKSEELLLEGLAGSRLRRGGLAARPRPTMTQAT